MNEIAPELVVYQIRCDVIDDLQRFLMPGK
jgi:hypothetical protein